MIIDLKTPFDEGEIPNEWWFERMRRHRDRLLVASDWAMAPDSPTNKNEWATYRQALRDFPATWTPRPEADFPEAP
jgi:hypothetical protein